MSSPAKPGRPRRTDVEDAVAEATLQLLAEAGYAALSLEAVARSTGISRPTLYRRWSSKATLVAEVISRSAPPVERHVGDDLRDNIWKTYWGLSTGFDASGVAPTLLVLVGEAQHDAELRKSLRENYLAPREQAAVALLEEAIASGLLRNDLPARVMHQMVMGSLFFGHIALGEPLAGETVGQVFAALWEGLARRDTAGDGVVRDG
jgi:AcrR family transcriptional regulator